MSCLLAQVDVTMTAQPQRPIAADEGRSGGLKGVTHVIAVSSCKGGVLLSLSFSSHAKDCIFWYIVRTCMTGWVWM